MQIIGNDPLDTSLCFFYEYHHTELYVIIIQIKYFCFFFIIYVKINFYLSHLSLYDYCIYTCAHKGVFCYLLINVGYRYTA